MAILAGERVTAPRLNRLQTKTYTEDATGGVAASTSGDVPGASITLTTETDGAGYVVHASGDWNPTGVPGGDSQIRVDLDGVDLTGLIIYRSSAATDRMSLARTWAGTIATAGSHTFKLEATTASNTVLEATHTTITVQIVEVV